MQYSFLPSPMSFMADRETARNAGRALFDAVYERWSQLPSAERPRLYEVPRGCRTGPPVGSGDYLEGRWYGESAELFC